MVMVEQFKQTTAIYTTTFKTLILGVGIASAFSKAAAWARFVLLDHGHIPHLALDNLPELGLRHAGRDVAEENLLMATAIVLGGLLP